MENIIFDFDGVICDTVDELYKIHNRILEKISKKDMLNNVFDKNPREYIKKFSSEKIDEFEGEWKKHYKTLEVEKEIKQELSILSKKYNLFIVSSNTEYNLKYYLNKNGMNDFFKDIYGVETHHLKYDKFKLLFDKYNLTLEKSIFVTDTLGDLIEANKFSLKSIAVDFGFHTREKLEQASPYKIVSSFGEIRKIIDEI